MCALRCLLYFIFYTSSKVGDLAAPYGGIHYNSQYGDHQLLQPPITSHTTVCVCALYVMHAERDWEIKLQSNSMTFEGQRLCYKRQHILTIHLFYASFLQLRLCVHHSLVIFYLFVYFSSEGLSAYCMHKVAVFSDWNATLLPNMQQSPPDFSAFQVKLRFSSHLIIVWTEHGYVHSTINEMTSDELY